LRKEDKNNDNFKPHWPFVFNAIIESLNLREIALSGRQFTWANRRENPTYEKLDRVLSTVNWQKIPLVAVRALTRSGSDHAPLLIDSGNHAHIGNKSHFSFELSWLKHEGFYEIVRAEWEAETRGDSPISKWQNKIRHIRRFLKGWEKCLSGHYKKEKEKLISLIDELDLRAEITPLDDDERTKLRKANEDLTKLGREEESKWAQRAKVKHIQEGG
jgi:hypothetical protein